MLIYIVYINNVKWIIMYKNIDKFVWWKCCRLMFEWERVVIERKIIVNRREKYYIVFFWLRLFFVYICYLL